MTEFLRDEGIESWDDLLASLRKDLLLDATIDVLPGTVFGALQAQGLFVPVRAFRTAAWTIPAAPAKLVLDTKSFDPVGAFNTTTGVYTCPTAGSYWVSATVGGVITVGNGLVALVTKNNRTTDVVQFEAIPGVTGNTSAVASDITVCRAGDTIEFWPFGGSGANTGDVGTTNTFMYVMRVT